MDYSFQFFELISLPSSHITFYVRVIKYIINTKSTLLIFNVFAKI